MNFQRMTYPEVGLTDEELDRIMADPNTKWVSAAEVESHLTNHLNRG